MKKIFMSVYNFIENDGRVQRSINYLENDFNINLLSLKGDVNNLKFPNSNAHIYRSFLKSNQFPTPINLAVFWVEFLFLALSLKPDAIYIHDYHLTLPGLIASRLTNSKLIYDAHELIIPEKKIRLSYKNYFFYILEKLIIKYIDLLIVTSSDRANIMSTHYKLNSHLIIIRNIVKSTLNSISKSIIFKKYPSLCKTDKSIKYLAYVGHITFSRKLNIILDSLCYLPNNISLVLIGDGPDLHSIIKPNHYNKGLKSRIISTGRLPNLWVQDVLSLCDLGLIIYDMKGLNNYFCSPNKIYEYIQAALPVVASNQPPLNHIINQFKIGVNSGVGDNLPTALEFSDSIKEVLNKSKEFENNISEFKKSLNFSEEKERLKDSIKELF